MSREQVNTFKKIRDTVDVQGNLTWAARLGQKALRQGPEAAERFDVEAEFELIDEEKIIWRLLRLPRKYMDIEHCGLMPVDRIRSAMRGLVAADVVDIVEGADAKALLPAEIKRMKAELAGKSVEKRSEPLRGRVYRPDISGAPPTEPPASSSSSPPESPAQSSPGFTAPAQSSPSISSPAHSSPGIAAPARSSPGITAPPRTSSGITAPPRTSPGPASPRAASSPGFTAPARSQAGVLSDEDRYYRDEIERAFIASSKQNHYEFLGVARPTDDAAVRAAYVRLARVYHPDRVAAGMLSQDETLKSRVDLLFKKLGEAQAAVANADARQSYDRNLEALGNIPLGADGKRQRRPGEAKNAFLMAETYFKKKDLKQAEAHYRQANMFDPEDPKILTALAWCIFVNPDHNEAARATEARKRLADVVSQHRYADAAYKLGMLMRKQNDETGALRQFAIAHKLDPEHVEAQREARLAESRHKKAEQEKKDANSLFGKLGLKK